MPAPVGRALEYQPTNKVSNMRPHIENKRFWNLPEFALRYIIVDCREAMAANPDNPKCIHGPGNYADQICDASTVIHYRNEHKIRRPRSRDPKRDFENWEDAQWG